MIKNEKILFLICRCVAQCPELDACISQSLVCDGHRHCPSGWDENGCSLRSRIAALVRDHATALTACGTAVVAALIVVIAALVMKAWKGRQTSQPKRLPTADRLLLSSDSSTLSSWHRTPSVIRIVETETTVWRQKLCSVFLRTQFPLFLNTFDSLLYLL